MMEWKLERSDMITHIGCESWNTLLPLQGRNLNPGMTYLWATRYYLYLNDIHKIFNKIIIYIYILNHFTKGR